MFTDTNQRNEQAPAHVTELTQQGLRLFGFLIIVGAICADLVMEDPRLNLVSIAGLLAIFFDRVFEVCQLIKRLITGTSYIVGARRIYEKQLALISSARPSDQLAFLSPVTHFGAYTLGAWIYIDMIDQLKAACQRGVIVRILCDAFDDKSLLALRGILDTGAEVRIRRTKEPWRYFLIAPAQRTGIELRTRGILAAPDGRTYRPLYRWALRLRRRQVQQYSVEFEEQFAQGVPIAIKQLEGFYARLLSLMDETQTVLKNGAIVSK